MNGLATAPVVGHASRSLQGWFWYDVFGRDYGPYGTKHKAEVLGPQHSEREERMLKGISKWARV